MKQRLLMLFSVCIILTVALSACSSSDFTVFGNSGSSAGTASVSSETDSAYSGEDNSSEVSGSEMESQPTAEQQPPVAPEGELWSHGACGDNLTYELYSSGVMQIKGTGEMWDNCFLGSGVYKKNGQELRVGAVIIESGVTSIGNYAFSGSRTLTSVTIPDSVTSIGDMAFQACDSLTSIDIPGSVTTIGWQAFGNCSSLTSVTIPEGVTSIEADAFSFCLSLTDVTIPSSVTGISSSTFACSGLTNITIPDSVTSIGGSAFECSPLRTLTIPGSVTHIGKYVVKGCSNLESVIIQEGVTCIGESAFAGGDMKSVTIPATVTSIEAHAFNSCLNLKDVYYGGSEAEWNVISIDYTNTTTNRFSDNSNRILRSVTIHYNSN